MTGIERISKERAEHFSKHGWTLEHDMEHERGGSLAHLAGELTHGEAAKIGLPWGECEGVHEHLEDAAENIMRKPRIERLVVAGALIAAEIDRLSAVVETGDFQNYRANVIKELRANGMDKIDTHHEDAILACFDDDDSEEACIDDILSMQFD